MYIIYSPFTFFFIHFPDDNDYCDHKQNDDAGNPNYCAIKGKNLRTKNQSDIFNYL